LAAKFGQEVFGEIVKISMNSVGVSHDELSSIVLE